MAMAESFEGFHRRDIEDINKAIESARLKESELLPLVQPLCISNQSNDDLKLIQISPQILNKVVEGQLLTIRGEPNEIAVLCTESSTFEIKEAETSNSLLLIQNVAWPADCKESENAIEKQVLPQEITGIFHTYYELRICRPKLQKLRLLLERNPYLGKEYEDDENGERYTFKDLLNCIQASEEELKSALQQMQACTIDGYTRILDFDYKFTVFSRILNLVDSESLPLNRISKTFVVNILEDLEPRQILDQCFPWYASDTGHKDEKGDNLYALKEDDVCRFYAEVLLKPAGKFHLQEFLESWQKSIPEGMTSKLSQLEGLALTDLTSRPEVIFYFSAQDLPENINDRFNKLFKTKMKWTYDEIVPYVRDLTSPSQDVKALLTRYTRTSMNNGIKMFSSRW